MPGMKQQYTNRQRMPLDWVYNAIWVWGVVRTNMGTCFVLELVHHIHTLLRTTILAVNDPMLLNNGKIALTQQSTSMVETVSIGG